jgi:hypothetical protein
MEPMCKIHDFYEYKNGERKLIVPRIVWNKINLRDIDTYLSNLIGLLAQDGQPGTGKLSTETLFEFLDLDYNAEAVQLRKETIDMFIKKKEAEALQKMSLEELRSLDPIRPILDLHIDEKPEEAIAADTDEGGGMLGLESGGVGAGGGGGGPDMSALGLEEPGVAAPTPEGPMAGGVGEKPAAAPTPEGGPAALGA